MYAKLSPCFAICNSLSLRGGLWEQERGKQKRRPVEDTFNKLS